MLSICIEIDYPKAGNDQFYTLYCMDPVSDIIACIISFKIMLHSHLKWNYRYIIWDSYSQWQELIPICTPFFLSAIKIWNSLPQHVIDSKDIDEFK